jgi:hypothetical protein
MHAAPAGLAVAVLEVGAFLKEVLHEVLALRQQLWADPNSEADDEQQDKQADDRERPMRLERGMAYHPLGRATQRDGEQRGEKHQQQLAVDQPEHDAGEDEADAPDQRVADRQVGGGDLGGAEHVVANPSRRRCMRRRAA